jgi:transcriptional regulator GlxA family with amidase domain
MTKTRRILFLLYDGFELLDLGGLSGVFASANQVAGETLYQVVCVSGSGGLVTSGIGVPVWTQAIAEIDPGPIDTILLVGAEEGPLRRMRPSAALQAWLARAAQRAERYGSVCTGALILARCRLLDGRRATSHWQAVSYLARRNPAVTVENDRLYVVDGRLWTSAGATTGIDMALAMVERDQSGALMGQVARRLVVYAHRPGNQSQFSPVLDAQTAKDGRFAQLVAWMEQRLDQPLSVEILAAQTGMSERGFRRHFTAQTGISPGKFVDALRLDRAKALLAGGMPVKQVAAGIGFRSESAFRKAFQAKFAMAPSLHRVIHSGNPAT